MKRYRIKLFGRVIGAIGICSYYSIEVEAESRNAAKLEAYKTHEHISFASVEELP